MWNSPQQNFLTQNSWIITLTTTVKRKIVKLRMLPSGKRE